MTLELVLLLLVPLAGVVPAYLVPRQHQALPACVASALAALLLALDLARRVLTGEEPPLVLGAFRVDLLAAPFLVLVAAVLVLAQIVALAHHGRDVRGPETRRWALLSSLAASALLFVVVCDHLGLLWIGMESSALLGALLVGSRGGAVATRAAVKYMLLGGAGLVIALLGTTLLYHAGAESLGEHGDAFSYAALVSKTAGLHPAKVVRLAFVCGLVGYGAKVGLFPLHAWKSDAYSAAPPPAAGLLAGAAVAASLLALLRFAAIARAAGEAAFVDPLLRWGGFASVLAATLFLVRERDILRLFALTSIEQMGFALAAFGLGSEGTRGCVLQLFGNAILKTVAFGLAGEVVRSRGDASIDAGRGLFGRDSKLGAAFLVVLFAALGFPPFGLFQSELLILEAGLQTGHEVLVAGLVVCLAVAFTVVARTGIRAVFDRSDDVAGAASPLPPAGLPRSLALAALAALVASTATGSLMPQGLMTSLEALGRATP